MTSAPHVLRWGHQALEAEIRIEEDGTTSLTRIGLPGGTPVERRSWGPLPLVEVTAAGHGRSWSGGRLIDTSLGGRLRYHTHQVDREGDWHVLSVELRDPETGLGAEVLYRSPDGVPVVRSEVVLRNGGTATLHLESVSSLIVGCLADGRAAIEGADLLWAENDWVAECRWQRRPMRVTSPVLNDRVVYSNGKSEFTQSGRGVWSSCGRLPMGGLTDRHGGRTWLWQIEHNGGGWHWACGERDQLAYVALFGPNDTHHGWRHPLEPGDAFRTVPVALAFSADGGPDEAFAALTRYRRAIRRPHPDHQRLPVIFNDYMNCLMGDPTTDKLLPLIDAATEAGAEYFVIDAGWYDADNGGWWDSVGAWEAFTMLNALLGRIHLSGPLPELRPEARALVHEGIATYKAVRADLARAVPAWPLGLPAWDDPWLALSLHTPAITYLTVWRRPGPEATAPLPLPHLRGFATRAEVLYPAETHAAASWNPDSAVLTLTLPTAPSAVLLRLTPTASDAP